MALVALNILQNFAYTFKYTSNRRKHICLREKTKELADYRNFVINRKVDRVCKYIRQQPIFSISERWFAF